MSHESGASLISLILLVEDDLSAREFASRTLRLETVDGGPSGPLSNLERVRAVTKNEDRV